MTIYLLALHGIATGGPEATHQLSDALIEQGFDARMVYYEWADLRNGLPDEFPEYRSFAKEYDRYKVNFVRSIPDNEGDVIVLPETACMLAPFWKNAKVLIWWLSVDNGFGALATINLNHLRKPGVFHACQSLYAERFIEALGFRSLGMLSDYTIDLAEYATPLPMDERPKLVVFNARADKVIFDLDAIAKEIHAIDPDIKCCALAGVGRKTVAEIFAQARVYVDFGNFPGKDRLPREAVLMGCYAICAPFGAGEEPFALYAEPDAPDFAKTIATLCETHIPAPKPLGDEREAFFSEVHSIFTTLTGGQGYAAEAGKVEESV